MTKRTARRMRAPMPAAPCPRAFTLLEAVLTIALTIVLMSGVFAFYMHILRAREAGVGAIHDAKLNRAILAQMAHEIRHATAIVPGDGVGFRGDRHRIAIVYLALPDHEAFREFNPDVDMPPPAQNDLRRVTYQLLWDDEQIDAEGVPICHGLWRTHQRMFDPNPQFVVQDDDVGTAEEGDVGGMAPQAEGELIAPEIKYLTFEYFDGAEWRDRWQFAADAQDEVAQGELGGEVGTGMQTDVWAPAAGGKVPDENSYALPQAVRITVGRVRVEPEDEQMGFGLFDPERDELEEHHPDRFTIVVPLLAADRTLLSSRQYGVADSIARQEGGMR